MELEADFLPTLSSHPTPNPQPEAPRGLEPPPTCHQAGGWSHKAPEPARNGRNRCCVNDRKTPAFPLQTHLKTK